MFKTKNRRNLQDKKHIEDNQSLRDAKVLLLRLKMKMHALLYSLRLRKRIRLKNIDKLKSLMEHLSQ